MKTYTEEERVSKKLIKQKFDEAFKNLRANPGRALEQAEESLNLAQQIQYHKYIIKNTELKGNCFVYLSKIQEGIEQLHKALAMQREHLPNDKIGLSGINTNIGLAHSTDGNYQLALDYLYRAKTLRENKPYYPILTNIGIVHLNLEKYEQAIEYFEASLELTKGNNISAEVSNLYNLATCYFLNEDIGRAKKYILLILGIIDENIEANPQLTKTQLLAKDVLANIYSEEGNYEAAIHIYDKLIADLNKESFFLYHCSFSIGKSKVYFAKKDTSVAIKTLLEALKIAQKNNLIRERKKILQIFIDFYEKEQQLHLAYPYLKQLQTISDEQFTQSRDENLQTIITKREEEIALLEQKNKEIHEHNKILEQFAKITAHDLREPIRGITGFTSLLLREGDSSLSEKGREYLNFILAETKSINESLSSLLEYAALKKVKLEQVQEINFSKVIPQIQQKYSVLPFSMNITYDLDHFKMYPNHAFILLKELIDNAQKFRKPESECTVEIKGWIEGNTYHLTVKDNGIGMHTTYHEKVFNIFYQLDKTTTGVGAGLAICERIVHLYKGKIGLTSSHGEYTLIHAEFPC